MANYQAPSEEVLFVLNKLLTINQLTDIDHFSEATPELLGAVVDEAAKFAEDVFAPINRLGDTQGNTLQDGSVITIVEFKQAYKLFIDNAWLSLAQSPKYGGQGLPFTAHMVVNEFWNSANLSLTLCAMLTAGAIDAIGAHANDELKGFYLPKLISGEWAGTMNLTEPHAGSDLSMLKTRATPEADHYLIRGQKIYITWGDHDMTDNIIHLVLAPTVDAPEGVKGLSLFLVPKYLANDDGSLGARNDVNVVSIEHKLGIHASPTCVMSFGEQTGAVGYLIGELGQGLSCMFTLMNHARLEVGLEGVALSERAYQDAVDYARQRIQGRDLVTGQPVAIIEHADVQRMLMHMKAMTDAMRALCYDAAISHDLRSHATNEEVKAQHEARFALLTPVVKAWCTELVNEVTSLAIQVHGGMGFIEETGVAQYYRDARITAIYEGTNGIQANDLVGRKLLKDNGVAFNALMQELEESIESLKTSEALHQYGLIGMMLGGMEDLRQSARYILDNAKNSSKLIGATAFNFLMQMGYVCGAWYHLRTADLCVNSEIPFEQAKFKAARFYFSHLLPRAMAYKQTVTQGADINIALNARDF